MSYKEYQPPGITPLVYTSSGSKDFWFDPLRWDLNPDNKSTDHILSSNSASKMSQ